MMLSYTKVIGTSKPLFILALIKIILLMCYSNFKLKSDLKKYLQYSTGHIQCSEVSLSLSLNQ